MCFAHLTGPGLCSCGIISIVLPISHSVCVLLSSCVAERAGSEWIPEASHRDCLFRSRRISEHSSHFKGRDECLSLQKSASSMRGNISMPAPAAFFGDNYIITHYTWHRLLLKTGPLLLKKLKLSQIWFLLCKADIYIYFIYSFD